jgi:hypothetical protein
MLINDFVTRFAAKNDKSQLFEALRRVGQLDRQVLLQSAVDGWAEWPPVDDPGSPGVGMARA